MCVWRNTYAGNAFHLLCAKVSVWPCCLVFSNSLSCSLLLRLFFVCCRRPSSVPLLVFRVAHYYYYFRFFCASVFFASAKCESTCDCAMRAHGEKRNAVRDRERVWMWMWMCFWQKYNDVRASLKRSHTAASENRANTKQMKCGSVWIASHSHGRRRRVVRCDPTNTVCVCENAQRIHLDMIYANGLHAAKFLSMFLSSFASSLSSFLI